MTTFTITLEWQGKEYTYKDEITSTDKQKAEDWPDEVLAEYMYEEGNYACDCNRSLFLQRYCGVSFKDVEGAKPFGWEEVEEGEDGVEVDDDELEWELPCGDTIKLISLDPRPNYVKQMQTVYVQQVSGIYLPTSREAT